jgi:hypothetical protein
VFDRLALWDARRTPRPASALSVETASGKWQVWFCHSACFKSRITNGAIIDVSPAQF